MTNSVLTRKLSPIEDRGQTDHLGLELELGLGLGLGLGLISDIHLQFQASYGCKRSKSKVSRFKRVETDGQTDGRAEATALPPVLTQSVKTGYRKS